MRSAADSWPSPGGSTAFGEGPLAQVGPWASRLRSLINGDPRPFAVVQAAGGGTRALLESMESVDRPLITVDVPGTDDRREQLGNGLIDSINRATRSQLLHYGLAFGDALRAFDRFVDLLGPFVFAVSGCQNASVVDLERLLAYNRSGSKVLLFGPFPEGFSCTGCRVLSDELRLTLEEALWLSEGRLSPQSTERLLGATNGALELFVTAVAEELGARPAAGGFSEGMIIETASEFGLDAETVLLAVMKRKKYIEAFRLACERVPAAIPGIIDECGEAFFARGLFERFWILLTRLPDDLLRVETVLRWYYATSMALNRHPEVIPIVEEYLRTNEAPELRAQYAASRPKRDLLDETTRALIALESPITLRHHAFALSLNGRLTESIETMQRALRLAQLLGRDQLIVAIATDISTALQRKGAFRESLWWGEWATNEYVERGLNEQYRRMCALSTTGFSKILVGEQVGLSELIQELQISEDLLGVPSYEGIVSTVADAFFVRGELERALRLYRAVYESNPFDQVASASVDYVKCLCELSRAEEAYEIASKVAALSSGASDFERSSADLALGIAERAVGARMAIETLRRAANAFSGEGDAVRFLQAKINILLAIAESGGEADARREFGEALPLARQLGASGWTLLGGHSPSVKVFSNAVERNPVGADVRLLGTSSVMLDGFDVDVSDRQLDLLALLISVPNGLSLQEVAARLYGDRGVLGTTKALISRLRGTIPIQSRPYRLAVMYQADFLDLLEHLKRGRVRQALNLYKGPLLPTSEAPAVVELREHIDEALRQAVLASGDAEAMIELANRTDAGDLELLETAYDHLPQNDPQSPLLRARIRQIRRDWDGDDGGRRGDPRGAARRRASE